MTGNVTQLPKTDARPVVALVAHDRRKDEMVEWALFNRGTLSRCSLYATRTTGHTLREAMQADVHLLLSGPLGGDAQLGSLIAGIQGGLPPKYAGIVASIATVGYAVSRGLAKLLPPKPGP